MGIPDPEEIEWTIRGPGTAGDATANSGPDLAPVCYQRFVMATGNPTYDPVALRLGYRTEVGLLWLDRDNVGVEKTLPQAIARFKAKFGRSPVVIYLSERTIAQEYAIGKLKVMPVKHCPPRHAMLF